MNWRLSNLCWILGTRNDEQCLIVISSLLVTVISVLGTAVGILMYPKTESHTYFGLRNTLFLVYNRKRDQHYDSLIDLFLLIITFVTLLL